VALADVQDAALSANGTQLFSLSRTALLPVEPAALTLGTAVDAPSLPTDSFLKSLAVVNNNTAVITTGINNATATIGYVFTSQGAMVQSGLSLNNGTIGGSSSGLRLVLMQGDPSATTDLPTFTFTASNLSFNNTSVTLRQNAIAPAQDRNSTRVVLNGTRVYNVDLTLIGTLPDTTTAVVVRQDGTRAYTYDSSVPGVRTFDISTAVTDAGAFTPVGSPVTLAGDPGAGVKMAISPDGNTLFLAGASQIVVQPTP
jgi:hypothetical protein